MRYWAEFTTIFCGMSPAVEGKTFFYSDSAAPETDFRENFKLDEGHVLESVRLTKLGVSPLMKEQIR